MVQSSSSELSLTDSVKMHEHYITHHTNNVTIFTVMVLNAVDQKRKEATNMKV